MPLLATLRFIAICCLASLTHLPIVSAQTNVVKYAIPYGETTKPDGMSLVGPSTDTRSTKAVLSGNQHDVTISVSSIDGTDDKKRYYKQDGVNFEVDGHILQLNSLCYPTKMTATEWPKPEHLYDQFYFHYWKDGYALNGRFSSLNDYFRVSDYSLIPTHTTEAGIEKPIVELGKLYPYIKKGGQIIHAQELTLLGLPILVFFTTTTFIEDKVVSGPVPRFWNFILPGWKINTFTAGNRHTDILSIEKTDKTTINEMREFIQDDLSLVLLVSNKTKSGFLMALSGFPWHSIVDLSHPEKMVINYPSKRIELRQVTDPRLYLNQVNAEDAYTAMDFQVNEVTVQYAHHLPAVELHDRVKLWSGRADSPDKGPLLERFDSMRYPRIDVASEPRWPHGPHGSKLDFEIEDVRFITTYETTPFKNTVQTIVIEFPRHEAFPGSGKPTLVLHFREHALRDGIMHHYQSYLVGIRPTWREESDLDRER